MSQTVNLLADASKSVLGTKYQTLQKWHNETVLKGERKRATGLGFSRTFAKWSLEDCRQQSRTQAADVSFSKQ